MDSTIPDLTPLSSQAPTIHLILQLAEGSKMLP